MEDGSEVSLLLPDDGNGSVAILPLDGAMDGAATLTEAANKLLALAVELQQLEAAGWRLRGPIEGNYGFIYKGDD